MGRIICTVQRVRPHIAYNGKSPNWEQMKWALKMAAWYNRKGSIAEMPVEKKTLPFRVMRDKRIKGGFYGMGGTIEAQRKKQECGDARGTESGAGADAGDCVLEVSQAGRDAEVEGESANRREDLSS